MSQHKGTWIIGQINVSDLRGYIRYLIYTGIYLGMIYATKDINEVSKNVLSFLRK